MIRVGLTGGIGSGKSYIAEIFCKLKVPVFNSDLRAREISDTSEEARAQIISHFGNKAYNNDSLNRRFIAGMVFENPLLLEKLNKILHPLVEKEFEAWCSENNSSDYIIKEAAILFETGNYKKLDSTILVAAPEDIRITRVQKRDNSDRDSIIKRMENQWDDQVKEKLADYIIYNDGKTLILPQIIEIHKRLTD